MGYRIFKICLQQLFRNWKIVIRLSWILIVIDVIATWWTLDQIAINEVKISGVNTQETFTTFAKTMLVVIPQLIVVVVGITSIAISWHRFILRDEIGKGFFLLQPFRLIGAYLWRSIKIGLVSLVVAVPVLIITGIVSSMVLPTLAPGSTGSLSLSVYAYLGLFSLITGTLYTWLIMRIGLILPAIAVGKDMPISDSYSSTKKFNDAIIVAAFLVTLLQSVPSIFINGGIIAFDAQTPGLLINLLQTIFNWLGVFVGVGVLTVLYGHVIEERPL
ncbi:MAG: hypothetical protein COA52_02345 [Hyphomicrobiales bacterium]|nr:MAG: hypothetical protein COA52_02345 [Hyphomicrobiales bacterium]